MVELSQVLLASFDYFCGGIRVVSRVQGNRTASLPIDVHRLRVVAGRPHPGSNKMRLFGQQRSVVARSIPCPDLELLHQRRHWNVWSVEEGRASRSNLESTATLLLTEASGPVQRYSYHTRGI